MNIIYKNTNFLSFLDIYSISPNMKINGKNSYNYMLSLTLSIFCIISSLIISIYFVIFFWQKRSVSIVYNVDSLEYPVNNITEFPITLYIYDSFGNPIPEQDKYFYFTARHWNYKVIRDEKNNPKIVTNVTDIKMKRCDIDTDFGNYKQYFLNTPDLNYKYCVPPNSLNMTLYGFLGDVGRGNGFITFFVNKCINGIDGKKDCYELEKIDSTLTVVQMEFAHLNYDIDHSKIDDPRVLTRKIDMYQLSSTIFKRITKHISSVNYATDYGNILEDIYNVKFFLDDRDEIEYDFRKEGIKKSSFSSIFLVSSSKTQKYKRSFTKLQGLLANIGGFINGIFILGKIISALLSKNLLTFVLFDLVFNKSDKIERLNLKEKLIELVKNQNQPYLKLCKINENSKGFQMINDNTINVFNFNSTNLNLENKK
jgi:hypothetical protein